MTRMQTPIVWDSSVLSVVKYPSHPGERAPRRGLERDCRTKIADCRLLTGRLLWAF